VPNGVSGRALQLDQLQGGFVTFDKVLGLTSGDFSIVVWVRMRTNDATADFVVLGRSSNPTAGWSINANSTVGPGGEGKAVFFAGDSATATSQTSINDGRWHQLVATCRADSGAALYVNGAPVEASTAATPVLETAAQLVLGGVSSGGQTAPSFTGWIDEVQIYDRVLSEAEIDYLYRNPGRTPADNPALPRSVEVAIHLPHPPPPSLPLPLLSFDTVPGLTYQVLRTTNLSPPTGKKFQPLQRTPTELSLWTPRRKAAVFI
jgi:hypothetical protein